VETGIVGDKEIDTMGASARKLNRVWCAEGGIPAQFCMETCRFFVQLQQSSGCRDGATILIGKFGVSEFHRLYKQLTQGEGGRQQLISTHDHLLTERDNVLPKYGRSFK
jgi:hypothetical protein